MRAFLCGALLLLTAAASAPPLPPVTSFPEPASPNPVPAPAAPIKASETAKGGPKVQFATPVYDFGRVKSGEVVKYTFVFTNIGNAPLEIRNVQTSCGCTTAGDWSRLVQPGETGTIPVQFHSANLSGMVAKTVSILSNDTNQPMVSVQIKGTIWRPIDVTPQFAVINVTPETPSNSVTVRIVNNMEEPITLFPPTSSNPFFTAEVRTNQPGKEYQLVIRTVPGETMVNAQGQISLKTSSTNMPVVAVSAWANMQPTIMAIPSQITLPSTPLFNPMPFSISIRNNGTNHLVLSDPAINAQNVDVQLKELEPGRFFLATLSFPAGFQMEPTDRIELTIKTNHPRHPLIKVPVYRPATAPVGTVLSPIRPAPAPPVSQTNTHKP